MITFRKVKPLDGWIGDGTISLLFKVKLFSTVLVAERKLFTKLVQLPTMGFKMVPNVILNGLILVL